MEFYPCFLSLVFVVKNQAENLPTVIAEATSAIESIVTDYEIIIVDNASTDDSIRVLKELTGEHGVANLQVFALTKEVDSDTAFWAGAENALGDYVAVLDPLAEDVRFVPEMLGRATAGADVVFASNDHHSAQSWAYRAAYGVFHSLYNAFNSVNLSRDAPQYRVLSRRVVNFILQHPQPVITYRHLPATGGFARAHLSYSAVPRNSQRKKIGESLDRGMRLLVSTTRAPMRLVTYLSLFGAGANVAYSVYVVLIGIFKANVAPGWVSFSLQQSGMFFLISLVLLVLGEYILNMASLSNEGPLYHVGQELTSVRMTRLERLNVEQVDAPDAKASSPESMS